METKSTESISQLIKQVINLNEYSITYRIPEDGFLFIQADTATVLILQTKESFNINKHTEKIYFSKNTDISIINPINLKNIRFYPWTIQDFIEDLRKGKFTHLDSKTKFVYKPNQKKERLNNLSFASSS